MMELLLNTYQTKALEYRTDSANRYYALLGLAGEVGELYSIFAKEIRDKSGYIENSNLEMVKKELGDILWFISVIADDFGFSLNEVAKANIAKLEDRFKRGLIKGCGDNR